MRIAVLALIFAFMIPAYIWADDGPTFAEAYRAHNAAVEAGEFDAALPHARAAYELGIAKYGEGSREHAVFAFNLGRAEGQVNGLEAAEPYLKESIEIYEKVAGKRAIELLDPLLELGDLFASDKARFSLMDSAEYYKRAMVIISREIGAETMLYANTVLKFGTVAVASGNRKEVVSALRTMKDLRKVIYEGVGDSSVQSGIVGFAIAKAYLALGDFKDARDEFLGALPAIKAGGEQLNHMLVSIHTNLVMVYDRLGNEEKASEHCVQVAYQIPARQDMDYQPLYREAPQYPQRALRLGKSGHVLIEFTVTEEGRVADAKVVEAGSPGFFEEAALAAIEKQWYAPRIVDGQPIATQGVKNLITFEISN